MRRAAAVLAGLGLLGLAFVVTFTEPDDRLAEEPFPVRGAVGQELVASEFAATVSDVRLATEVDADGWRGTTSGIWLVADVTGQATVEALGLDAEVRIDGVVYDATARYSSQVTDSVIAVGFPLVGPVLVELPAGILDAPGARTAVLRLQRSGDARLDSVTEVVLDLATLEQAGRITIDPAREAAP